MPIIEASHHGCCQITLDINKIPIWAYNGPANQTDFANAVVATSDSGAAVAGYTGTTDAGDSSWLPSNNALLAKFPSQG